MPNIVANTRPRSRFGAVIAALLSAVFFGLNAVASKLLFAPSGHFDATALFVARGFWSIPLFLGLAAITCPRPFPRLSATQIVLLIFCGAAYGPGTNALSALGASQTSAAHAVLLMSMFPPLAAVLAALVLRERLSSLRMLAIAVGMAGAGILTGSRSGSGSSMQGDAMIAAFIFTWALLTLGIRKLDARLPPLFVVGVFGAIGGVMLAVIGLAVGQFDAVLIPIRHRDLATIIWFDVELVLCLSLVGQLLQGIALKALNVALVVALTSYGAIAAGMAASVLLLRESLSLQEIIAGIFLVCALALSLIPEATLSLVFKRGAPPSHSQESGRNCGDDR